ncbi:M48 family metalloprotease [Marinobacterium sp. D7]|uniref:M48 family metalloprotease n=1 Tax=Marinobacterium ramblicola TaxID=2849041 RepID=UPI001C2D0308|nr:M48 family metalloprotease [Marinobacterium ramblicola]
MNLVYKHEKSLFTLAVIISTLLWLALIIGTFGIALAYILFGYLFFLFAHSAFISYLKGTGVRVSAEQYPDLHERLQNCCRKVGVDKVPEMYLLRTDFFNALATRFLGRHFIVLFTDVVDALEDQPGAIDFYIGHELGHIHRKHLLWSGLVAPASFLPLLGAALRRAEEYTCDRYGVACCSNEEDIRAALAAIAAGDTRWKSINTDAYLAQAQLTGGFWMSFNELTADYPWLTKRMAAAIALSRGQEIRQPGRSRLAWLLALFVPRVAAGVGGAASLLIVVAIIGVLAAVAVPAYQEYTERARTSAAYAQAQGIGQQVEQYAQSNGEWPTSLELLGYSSETLVDSTSKYEISLYEDGVIGALMGQDAAGEDMYLVLEPSVEEGRIDWSCYGQNMAAAKLPPACR